MRRSFYITILMLAFVMTGHAQQHHGFDYARFQSDMITFIANEAKLNAAQLQQFKPICEAMLAQKRVLFKRVREANRSTYTTNEDFKNAIQKVDKWELEMKTLEKTYHDNLLKVLPAQKVFLIIKAEAKYHKQVFRRAAGRR